jgi:Subtilisin inhibitor-like
MRRIAAAALIALATTGCIGSSAVSSGRPSSDSDLAIPWPKTDLTVTYYTQRCPPGARCSGHVESLGNLVFVRVARSLHCDPPSGDYADPSAACAALRQIVDKLAKKPGAVCSCTIPLHPGNSAVGIYEGKRRTIPLDRCSLCGVAGDIDAELAVLLPGEMG